MGTHVRAMERHLPYENAVLPATGHRWNEPHLNLKLTRRHSIYLHPRDGKLIWLAEDKDPLGSLWISMARL